MQAALVRIHPESGGIKSLRFVMTPSRHRKAWSRLDGISARPTTQDRLLTERAHELLVGPPSTPRSRIRTLVGSSSLRGLGSFQMPLEAVTRKPWRG